MRILDIIREFVEPPQSSGPNAEDLLYLLDNAKLSSAELEFINKSLSQIVGDQEEQDVGATDTEEPVDQIIGIMLFNKFNAVMEGRMEVTALDISSTQGDGVWYQHDDGDTQGPFVESGWWHESTLKHNDIETDTTEDNVVKVRPSDWLEYDLMWTDNDAPLTNNTVVFGKFPKDAD
jgi:hypothetical protein